MNGDGEAVVNRPMKIEIKINVDELAKLYSLLASNYFSQRLIYRWMFCQLCK